MVIFTTDNGHCPYTDLRPFEKVGHRVSGPLRGYKGDIWEGGHRVPFVARWPGKVPAAATCGELMSLADFMATCADITGAEIPEGVAEDSVSALPLLMGGREATREDAIFHSGKGFFSIIKDNWKLSLCPDSGGFFNPEQLPGGLPPVQLHDLNQDLGERANLQAEYPRIVNELTERIKRIVAAGRSTPGPRRFNDVPVDIMKVG